MGFALKATTRVFPTAPQAALDGQKPPAAVAAPKPVKILEASTKIKDIRLKDSTKAGAKFADVDASNATREVREAAKVRPVWFLPGVYDHDGAGLKKDSHFKAALPTTGDPSHWAQIAAEVGDRITIGEFDDKRDAAIYEATESRRAAQENLSEKLDKMLQTRERNKANKKEVETQRVTRAMEKRAAEEAKAAEVREVANSGLAKRAGDRAVAVENVARARVVSRGKKELAAKESGVKPRKVAFSLDDASRPGTTTRSQQAKLMKYVDQLQGRGTGDELEPFPTRPATRAELRAEASAAQATERDRKVTEAAAAQAAERDRKAAEAAAAQAAKGKGKGRASAPPLDKDGAGPSGGVGGANFQTDVMAMIKNSQFTDPVEAATLVEHGFSVKVDALGKRYYYETNESGRSTQTTKFAVTKFLRDMRENGAPSVPGTGIWPDGRTPPPLGRGRPRTPRSA